MSSAVYTFLPWLRQGLANGILESETDVSASLRPSIDVNVTLRATGVASALADETIPRTVRLYGPGDVLAIDRSAILKTEPAPFITNHEPNYLPYVDFCDEDFPWRYTPAHPDTGSHRHRPWLALLVLAEGEFADGNAQGKPLPFIDLADLTRLPELSELWAWAHVHVNRNLGASETVVTNGDASAIVSALAQTLAEDSDLAYSRLLSARRLDSNKPYHAFLVPTFESGRVAGLGLDVSKVDRAMRGAWEEHPERASLLPNSFPYYYRFYFHTGDAVDFESLVRLLVPQPMDARVGRRDLDVQRPALNLAGIPGPNADGVLRLGGALKVPDSSLDAAELLEAQRFENWDVPKPHPFERDLAAYIDLADDYAGLSAEAAHAQAGVPTSIGRLPDGRPDPDPLITPPLYGRWPSLTQRLLTETDGSPAQNTDNWVHQLNLDPRHRAAAGLGTGVVRAGQEDYVNAAWSQVGQVLDANRRIRGAQAALAVSRSFYLETLVTAARTTPERALALTSPIAKRVLLGRRTVHQAVQQSPVPASVLGAPMRRALRPTGRLVAKLAPEGATASAVTNGLVTRLNEGTLVTAQEPALPSGAPSVEAVSTALVPKLPAWLLGLLRRYSNAPLLALLLALLLASVVFWLLASVAAGLVVIAVGIGAYVALGRLQRSIAGADALLPAKETPAAVDALPVSASFALQPFGAAFAASAPGADSAEAVRFKQALRAEYAHAEQAVEAVAPPARVPFDVTQIAGEVVATVNPARTVPARLAKTVVLPERLKPSATDPLGEVMAYPRIEEPMYRPLVELGSELFLPNVGLIPQNSISLLETNQKFIESYMVGINHEFARELLWREYPTDQRGSYFRQFWDVAGYIDDAGLAADALREKLYDIPELHRWSKTSELGDHDNRQPPGSPPKDEVVLAIRGELLKRYPNAVIYAQRAEWQLTNGRIDQSKIRVLTPLTDAEEAHPPRDKLKTPLYEAKVNPDITFFGFDLSVEQAKGNPASDDAGWFFVIKERPGEPRFGLDLGRDASAPINTWNDLSWGDVTTEASLLRIRPGMQSYVLSTPPPSSEGPEEVAQYQEDRQIHWDPSMNAADLAYVLYQLPVLVAVHAAEMLPDR